jgi:hypothetical protein
MFDLYYADHIKDGKATSEFVSLQSQLSTWGSKEHNNDGTHANITAQNLTLQKGTVGVVTPLTFSATRFTSSTGTWAVAAATTLQYTRVGQLAFVQFIVNTSALSGSTSLILTIQVPELHGLPTKSTHATTGNVQIGGSCQWVDFQHAASGSGPVGAQATALTGAVPSTRIVIYPDDTASTPFPISNDLFVQGSCWFALTVNNAALPFFGM